MRGKMGYMERGSIQTGQDSMIMGGSSNVALHVIHTKQQQVGI